MTDSPTSDTPFPLRSDHEMLLRECLAFSEHFALTHDADGEPVVYRFTSPERRIRLTEETRILLSCFPGNRTIAVRQAVDTFLRHLGKTNSCGVLASVLDAVQKLVAVGVLVPLRGTNIMYANGMVSYYLRTRQVPSEIGSTIAASSGMNVDTPVLDIGTGTGSIALALAEHSHNVTGIDVCEPFLGAAKALAGERGLEVNFKNACGNKLIFAKEEYDVITICQAFHWLHPYWATCGVYRALRTGGSLYFVESKPALPSAHPLRELLGWGCLGPKAVEIECNRHTSSYIALFEALRPCDYLIHGTRAWLFHERRPFDMDFARAYFSTEGLRFIMKVHGDPWETLAESLAVTAPDVIEGDMYWLLIEFQKSVAQKPPSPSPSVTLSESIEIS
jgi:SAM-dependent methyltransferase